MGCRTAEETLTRIHEALEECDRAIARFIPGAVAVDFKSGDDPITEADRVSNRVLHKLLVRDGDGWLSEESVDDSSRLRKKRVWIVDPLDGTREFAAGIPEWCISVGLVEDGRVIAGGIRNPATDETFLGSIETGLIYNGNRARCSQTKGLSSATVLASRSEVKRGEWRQFENCPFAVKAMGSVAYKLALVAAGVADATWTLCPKHEWDVAAGVALIESAGGFARRLDQMQLTFNNRNCLLPNLMAAGWGIAAELSSFLEPLGAGNGHRVHAEMGVAEK
ncbi:MAG TPA: 3'(2'),5'-bisphosphate nucleotidase CysQ [Bryobacteraceae bacterium]|nr:3'(2'),5'-bisphosphate nucleotidase CysQ [Bryobacteraceae bacterium]